MLRTSSECRGLDFKLNIMDYFVSFLGFMIAFAYSFTREKDKYDNKKEDYGLKVYISHHYDNWGFTLLLALVWAMYGVDIWNGTIEPLTNFIARRFYDLQSPIEMPFYEPYYLFSGVFGWTVYHGIPTAKSIFNAAMKKIKGSKK